MEDYAYINHLYVQGMYGVKGHIEYSWEGNIRLPVRVHDLEYEDVCKLWPMKVLRQDEPFYGYICLRTDVNYWQLTFIKIKLIYAWAWFMMRLLATAVIWIGVHDWQPGVMHRWRDLNIVYVFVKLFNRLQV
jgi:hypothetical protein